MSKNESALKDMSEFIPKAKLRALCVQTAQALLKAKSETDQLYILQQQNMHLNELIQTNLLYPDVECSDEKFIFEALDKANNEYQEKLNNGSLEKEILQDLKTISIWCEGYAATGEHGTAKLLAVVDNVSNLKEACDKYSKQSKDFSLHYNPGLLTYWGCRLFDNREDAIKAYG